MGRSCATPPTAEGPSHSRTRRRRATQNVDNNETVNPAPGIADGNNKALYHCNYCNKDISGKIRIKCTICSDFDLCVECFSVGAVVYPHETFHSYRVMDNLAFPLICVDWNADEEMLLLEGLEMYGLCNWNEVAIHVATKSKAECIDHFSKVYLNSPCFPLPDMSRVTGKNREELLAMVREPSEIKKEIDAAEGSGSDKMFTRAGKRSINSTPGEDELRAMKLEDMSIRDKRPVTSSHQESYMKEKTGYNSKRHEFDIEYDNDAEELLADMEFNETDTPVERELKLRVLRIYSKRLDERKRRKDFIVERNLLCPDPFEKNLSSDEKELCDSYRVFMRYLSKEEYSDFLRTVVEEHRILRRIQTLQEARSAGCRTMADCERYREQKMKKEFEETAHQVMESSKAGPGGRYVQRVDHFTVEQAQSSRGSNMTHSVLDSGGKDSSSVDKRIYASGDSDSWDVTGFIGSELLSEADKKLCNEIRILPTHYLNMQETIARGILNGSLTKKSDAYGMFNVDPAKIDKIYDMLVTKGIARA